MYDAVIIGGGAVGCAVAELLAPIQARQKELLADTRSKLGALLAKPAFKRVAKTMDYTEVGGAPLLGVQGAVVKAHGSSDGHAIACAIGQCVKMIEGNVVELISANLEGILPKA